MFCDEMEMLDRADVANGTADAATRIRLACLRAFHLWAVQEVKQKTDPNEFLNAVAQLCSNQLVGAASTLVEADRDDAFEHLMTSVRSMWQAYRTKSPVGGFRAELPKERSAKIGRA